MELKLYNMHKELQPIYNSGLRVSKLLQPYDEWLRQTDCRFLLRPAKGSTERWCDMEMLKAVRSDGIDLLEMQQQFGVFNPSRNKEATSWYYFEEDRLSLTQTVIQTVLDCASFLPQSLLPSQLHVAIVPADCADPIFMRRQGGLSVYGRTPGYLLVRIWPTEGNLYRLGPAVLRALIHGIRRQEGALSLGEAVATEGVAAYWVQKQYGPCEVDHAWMLALQHAKDWARVLHQIAEWYGEQDYGNVEVNIYGSRLKAGSISVVPPEPYSSEELAYAWGELKRNWNSNEPVTVAGFLYGDMLLSEQGYPTSGVPAYSGFAVGLSLVNRFMCRHKEVEPLDLLQLKCKEIIE